MKTYPTLRINTWTERHSLDIYVTYGLHVLMCYVHQNESGFNQFWRKLWRSASTTYRLQMWYIDIFVQYLLVIMNKFLSSRILLLSSHAYTVHVYSIVCMRHISAHFDPLIIRLISDVCLLLDTSRTSLVISHLTSPGSRIRVTSGELDLTQTFCILCTDTESSKAAPKALTWVSQPI